MADDTQNDDGGAMAGVLSVTPTMIENLPPLGKPLRGKHHVLRISVGSKVRRDGHYQHMSIVTTSLPRTTLDAQHQHQ